MKEVERIAELEDEGYLESASMCQKCGTFLMLRIYRRIRHDVIYHDFDYVCPHCGNRQEEHYNH
jgi:RNase P subunit RPR2